MLIFRIAANRFLHGMVRAIVGTQLMLSTRVSTKESITDIIEAKNRKSAGSSVKPSGLFLYKVKYE